MVTATLARSRPASSSRRIFFRAVGAALLALVAAAAGVGLFFYHAATASLAQLDGAVRLSGLSAPVNVIRDAQGVPHITAASAEDLFFAQGYVTAQDRLWQMDVSRRWGAGEVSEVLGNRTLLHDREQRILGVRQVAERSAAALSERDRAYWSAYARGVNAYIETHRQNLPIEFRVLRYQPKPWTVVDSFLCGANMAQALNHYLYSSELAHERVLAKLGPQLAADLYPNKSWRDHPPGETPYPLDAPPTEEEDEQVPEPPSPARKKLRTSLFDSPVFDTVELKGPTSDRSGLEEPAVPGSNNWVVSGEHTVTGKPLLSNDMHLINTIPNTWYEAQLQVRTSNDTTPSFDVVGVTIPGMPFVIVGHNQRIAWGFTNLGPAVEDLYVENVNAKNEYQTPSAWQPLQRRRETIHIKNQPDITLDVMASRHGPIITELVAGETRPIALKWTLFDGPMTAPFFDVNSAQNWEQFRAAFAQFSGPSQNAVYADVDGHIGYQATGHIPLRANGDGSLPVSGADDAHEWTGYIPFEHLPSVFDPPNGIIVTANGRIAPDNYIYALSNEWGAPYRTERINRLLSTGKTGKKFSAADMLKVQTDVYSVFDHFCADRFVYAVDHADNASGRAKAAANMMRGWDGLVTVDSASPTVVAAARRELWRMLLEPHLGASSDQPPGANAATNATVMPQPITGWQQYSWFMSPVALENLLMKRPARWLPAGYHDYDQLLVAAVEAAMAQKDAPRYMESSMWKRWRWGAQHRIDLRHPIFGSIPWVGGWFGTGAHPIAGDGETVQQIRRGLGPSERMTVDFADFDNGYLNIVAGESGQIFSPHFMDQWNAWYGGTSFPLAFSDAAVQRGKQHELVLEPK